MKRALKRFVPLVPLLHGCGAASAASTPPETVALFDRLEAELDAAVADGVVDEEEWQRHLGPLLARAPRGASPIGRKVLSLLATPDVVLSPRVEAGVRGWLADYGYITTSERSSISVVKVLASHPMEPDEVFNALFDRVGGDKSIRIAVLEEGADVGHVALADHVVPEGTWDFSLHRPNLVAEQHGTAVASIAAAGTQRIKLVMTGSGRGEDMATWTDAVTHAAAMGVRVVNISFEFHAAIAEYELAITQHPELLFIGVAGNEAVTLGEGAWAPGLYSGAVQSSNYLVVTGVNDAGGLSGGSGERFVTHAARSHHYTTAGPGDGFGQSSGTSFSSPYVANLAAKCFLLAPSLTPAEVGRLLALTSTPLSSLSGSVRSGGVVDHDSALALAAVLGAYRRGNADSYREAALFIGLGGAGSDEVANVAVRLAPERRLPVVSPVP